MQEELSRVASSFSYNGVRELTQETLCSFRDVAVVIRRTGLRTWLSLRANSLGASSHIALP